MIEQQDKLLVLHEVVVAEEFFSHGRLNENGRDSTIIVQEFGIRRVDDMVSNQGFFSMHLGEIGG